MTLFATEACLACRAGSHRNCRGDCACTCSDEVAIPTQRTPTPSCPCGCPTPADPAERVARSVHQLRVDLADLVTPDVLASLEGALGQIERVVPTYESVSEEDEVSDILDPLAHIKVGDADPTPDDDKPECPSVGVRGFCTRDVGHPGQHIAGTGERVLAVWTDEEPEA